MAEETITATLKPIGRGCAEGDVIGHPCKHLKVRTWRGKDSIAISLWDGPHQIGDGALKERATGEWEGTCSEYAGTWKVLRIGHGVVFSNDPAS